MPVRGDATVGQRREAGIASPVAVPAPDPSTVPKRNLLLWVALAYLAFVIYGSLVPLDFHPRPLRAAWESFSRMWYLEPGVGSGADWVANILLAVPLAYLWLGALWTTKRPVAGAVASILVLSACLVVSVAIEFTQIFFPPRSASVKDVVAQALGAAIGVALWWATGRRFVDWLNAWSDDRGRATTIERFLQAYLALVFGYSVLPLDLTISVVEVYHKWQEGKVLLIPFSAVYESGAQRAYALLADVAMWIPAAFLWQLASSRPVRQVVLRVAACAAAIEVAQLFVYTRVTSTTDILTAACGATIGALLARRLRPEIGDNRLARQASSGGGLALLWVLALAGWMTVLMVVFWYPFNFSNEWGFVHGRVAELKRVPFAAYYSGTEFRAVTEVFHKTGFFFPLGALLAIGAIGIRRRFPVPAGILHAVGALVIAGAAAAIEIGQVFLPGKNADTTDWLLETLGGLAGYFCLWIVSPVWQSERGDGMPQAISESRPAPRTNSPA